MYNNFINKTNTIKKKKNKFDITEILKRKEEQK